MGYAIFEVNEYLRVLAAKLQVVCPNGPDDAFACLKTRQLIKIYL